MFIVAPLANSVPIHLLRRFPSPSLPILPTLRFPCRLSCHILLPFLRFMGGVKSPFPLPPHPFTLCPRPCFSPVQGSREDADVAARELQERLWDAEQRARTAQVWGSG